MLSPRAPLLILLLVLCSAVTAQTAPAPGLFTTDWLDRTPFLAELANEHVLGQLTEAPVHHLTLTLSDDLLSVHGVQELLFTNRTDMLLEDVVLRLYPNILGSTISVTEVQVDGSRVEPTLDAQESVLRIPLPLPLWPDDQTVIRTEFTLELSRNPQVSYGRLARYDRVLSLAHAYPTLAVFENGEWDTRVPPSQADPLYAEKAFFLVRVTAPSDVRLVASGDMIERQVHDDSQDVVFAAGPVRDFYLTGSTGYVEQRLNYGPTVIRSFAPEALTDSAWQGLTYARDALEVFTRRFGTYPYETLDIVAVPVQAGGIEFPGIVNVANTYYQDPGGFFETIVVHEVAHQWFFSLVGNDQVGEPWLDESLAQYLTLLYYQDVYGEAQAQAFRAYLRGNWAQVDFAPIPIGLPAEAYTPTEYSAIIYGRGALFFEALAEDVGQETLDAILREYTARFAWNIATTADFRAVAEEVCACDLSQLFEDWVY